jgi:hypothetical protein
MIDSDLSRRWTARIVGLLGAWLLIPMLACVSAASPAAADDDMLDLAGAQPLPNGSLLAMRGGFRIGGFDISFGVTMKATINGATELSTSFNILPGNQIDNQSVTLTNNGNVVYSTGNGNAAATTGKGLSIPLANAAGQNNGQNNTSVPNGSVVASANGFSLVRLDGGGFALTSVDTSVIQSVGGHSILSEVTNTANNQVIQTSLSANVFFNNFADMAGRADMNTLMSRIMTEQVNGSMLGP